MGNKIVVECHFKTPKRVLEENHLLNKCNKIFNMDESRINTDWRQDKIVGFCGSKQAHSQSKGLHDHIINCAVSTVETALPPTIIFKKAFPSTAYVTQRPINALYAKSPNKNMDEDLFYC